MGEPLPFHYGVPLRGGCFTKPIDVFPARVSPESPSVMAEGVTSKLQMYLQAWVPFRAEALLY